MRHTRLWLNGLLLALGLSGCQAATPPRAQPMATSQVAGAPAPTSESTPFPYTTPLPPLRATPLDGHYVKFDPTPGTPVPCRRCPDYLPSGGAWTLWFDRGIYRIVYRATGWRSVGSFTVQGDQLTLFNDPVCHREVGRYTWRLEHEQLILREIDDPCAIHLRAENLTRQAWQRSAP